MKKIGVLVLGLILMGVGAFAYGSVPNPGHGADEIFVYIDGKSLSLQDAISGREFSGNSYSGGGYIGTDVVHGHDTVYVNIGGISKDFQAAINDNSLCMFDGGSGGGTVGVSGHNGQEIIVNFNGEKTLQSAIEEGLFAGVPDVTADQFCSGQQFTANRCGVSVIGYGTKCCDSSWNPPTASQCNDVAFTQTSNCGNTRTAYGTSNCADSYGGWGYHHLYSGCSSGWDSCNGAVGYGQAYTCGSTESRVCWDYMNVFEGGDLNCLYRYVDCN